jgi:TolB-like protein/Flp pilus assembly protein TadD
LNDRLNGFLCELRRRKVIRVAGGYAVAGWLVIQVASAIFPALDLPRWSMRLVILVVLIGFPFALILAWAFDLGPHGLEKTGPAERGEECPPALKPKRRNVYVLAGIGIAVAALVGFFVLPLAWGGKVEKSIAVLPFENFSEDKENEHFEDGIQDDLLTNLAKVRDLKVISRTSVMPYRGKAHNIREIGEALGVGTVLEGSVRRDGNRVRVNVQLINVENDAHLWAQIYDRELTDVFAIQSDLAREIAGALRARLSPGETERINHRPTENSQAYLLYLQAHDIFTRPDRRHEDLARAEQWYEQAIQLDPTYALAYARLSHLESWIFYANEPTEPRRDKARAAANEALRIEPDLPEAHLALGYLHYYIERDYDRAFAELAEARKGLPNDAGVFRAIAAIQRRQGKWDKSIVNFGKAASLDPKDPVLVENLAMTYAAVKDYKSAREYIDRAVELAPSSFDVLGMRARFDFDLKGDVRPMKKLLAEFPPNIDPNGMVTLARYNYALYDRNFGEALAILERTPLSVIHGETSAPLPKSFLAAHVYWVMHDFARARAAYEAAREGAEQALEAGATDPSRHALLGLIYAGLGRTEEAKREAKAAVDLLPVGKDAFVGPIYLTAQARTHLMCGDADTALALLEISVAQPCGVTVHELRLDPAWDALRQDPRFKKLIGEN